MSFENKGSTVASVIVTMEPDRSGNFVCSGANDQVEIAAAITATKALGYDVVRFKAGTYDINNLTIAEDVVFIGEEEGVIFSLPAAPSLTVTTAVDYIVFERIKFLSTLDDTGHIVLNPVKATFRYCHFDLQLECDAEHGVITYNNNSDASDIIFEQCTLIGGKAGAALFFFFYTSEDMGSMIIRNFRIINITCDTTAGLARLWSGDDLKICDLLVAKEIIWEYLTGGGGSDSSFIYGTFRCLTAEIDGFKFLDGTFGNGHQYGISGAIADTLTISNVVLRGNSHCYSGRRVHHMSNVHVMGEATVKSAWDLQSAGEAAKYAVVENCTFERSSLTVNTGWVKTNISNCNFLGSRINIIDEGSPTIEGEVMVDNCQWDEMVDGYTYAFQLAFAQGIKLQKLAVTNCHIKNLYVVFTVGNCQGEPCHIVIENLTSEPRIDGNWPRLFDPGVRDNDNQKIWIFDSYITGDAIPLDSWNSIRPNDRFDNVVWLDIDDTTEYFSENEGVATIPNAAAAVNVTHMLATTPTWVLLTGGHAETTQLYATALGAATFTATTAIGVTSDDRPIFWRCSITR